MINPCAECLHHILGGSKNAPKCTNCKKRLKYVAVIGRHPSCPVPDGVNVNGYGGYDMPEIQEETTAPETKNIEPTEIDHVVRGICKKHLTDLETLRTGRSNPLVNMKKLSYVIQEIVETLAFEQNLKNPEIARILNVTPAAISLRLKKSKKNTKNLKDTKDTPGPVSSNKNYRLEIDFSEHPEIYDDLVLVAHEEMRTVENQLIYMVKSRPGVEMRD